MFTAEDTAHNSCCVSPGDCCHCGLLPVLSGTCLIFMYGIFIFKNMEFYVYYIQISEKRETIDKV